MIECKFNAHPTQISTLVWTHLLCSCCRQLASTELHSVFPSSSDAVVVLNASGGEGLKEEHRESPHCMESIHVS